MRRWSKNSEFGADRSLEPSAAPEDPMSKERAKAVAWPGDKQPPAEGLICSLPPGSTQSGMLRPPPRPPVSP